MAQLAPVARPIGIFDRFMAHKTETLVLKERIMSMSGDSFDVRTAGGPPLLKIQGHVMSLSGRKTVSDMEGTHLFDIVKEHFCVHPTYTAEDPQGRKILQVKSSFKRAYTDARGPRRRLTRAAVMGSKATAEFRSRDGRSETLAMRGNWNTTSADIVCRSTGATAARIERRLWTAGNMFGGRQTYALVVAPGVDMALMVALCVALDESH